MMLKTGKLDNDLLEQIVFKKITFRRPEVLTRPGIGEDCAVVDFGAYDCVLSTDPITAAAGDIGKLAVDISCNDIAASGVEPLGILLTVMLPEGTTRADVETIMGQAAEAAEALGVEIIGGHTEITPAVNRPVIVSTAIGRGDKNAVAGRSAVSAGDFILMTKTAGLEGTAILAGDFPDRLAGVLNPEELLEAQGLMRRVSVVREGVAAGQVGASAMHDITEGGVLGAVWEVCRRSELGAEVWVDAVPVLPVTRKICGHFGIDCLRLISSGSMLILTPPDKKDAMLDALAAAGAEAACIGVLRDKASGIRMVDSGTWSEIDPPAGDELYKVVG